MYLQNFFFNNQSLCKDYCISYLLFISISIGILMDLLNIYRLMKENDILFSFKGALNQEILVEMGNQIKTHLSMNKKLKKIFGIFIELSQNIMHYSDEREITQNSNIGIGIITFTESEQEYTITSGNLVFHEKADDLKHRIDNIKAMTAAELKEHYNEMISRERNAESKGAGLGFIDICRKSEGNINYIFRPYDDIYTFFQFVVKIDKVN